MKKITQAEILQHKIAILEIQHCENLKALQKQFHITYESLRPINLIKNTIKEASNAPDVTGGIGNAIMGIVSGFLAKKILFRSSINPLKNVAGMVLQTIVTNVVAKNSDKIRESGTSILHKLFAKIVPNKNKTSETEYNNI